jgi:protein-S-isoprenylcysteine O-methyltransferase Ste14
MKTYLKWAKRESSQRQRSITLFFAGIVFLLILPYLLVNTFPKIDARLHLPQLKAGLANPIAGLILVAGGFSLGLWSVGTQVTLGSGTPVPIMPTKKLLVTGPFAYCRNPMTLGTILAYGGIAVWVGSLASLAMVLLLALILLSYLKLVEEKELEARFGPDYVEYKRTTPFILPRLRPRR